MALRRIFLAIIFTVHECVCQSLIGTRRRIGLATGDGRASVVRCFLGRNFERPALLSSRKRRSTRSAEQPAAALSRILQITGRTCGMFRMDMDNGLVPRMFLPAADGQPACVGLAQHEKQQ